MPHTARFGTVIFTGDKDRLVRFYEAVAAMGISVSDAEVTVLTSDAFELVIHTLRDEPASVHSLPGRESYVKPFFPVASLSETRQRAAALGGRLGPADEEWEARDFRACEAIDPDGNPIQFRESAR